MQWSDFKAVIVTRHSIAELYEKNVNAFLAGIPYPKMVFQNPPAGDYVWHIITQFRADYDWVINIDDDAFLSDPSAIYKLLVYMRDNQYAYCGMPDGLTYTPRDIFNPASMNPFFNIFNLALINPEEIAKNAWYSADLLRKMDLSEYHPEIFQKTHETIYNYQFSDNYEPFYRIFFGLLRSGAKALLLYGRSFYYEGPECATRRVGIVFPDDPYTTVLYMPRVLGAQPFIYHTWYARDYYSANNPTTPPNNRARIDRMFEFALARKREIQN